MCGLEGSSEWGPGGEAGPQAGEVLQARGMRPQVGTDRGGWKV